MLAIDIIESKGFKLDSKTNSQIMDIVTPSWNTKEIEYQLKAIAFVSEEMQMRPDLVSLAYLSDQSGMGSLLKLNNISNPLSLLVGEVLLVPTRSMVDNLFNSIKSVTDQKQKARSFRKELQEKISQVSQERLNYLNSKNISNLSQTPLPPNLLQEGQQQILVEGGKLLFGPDIGQCRTKQKKNVSVTDIKSKLAQKNIFRR